MKEQGKFVVQTRSQAKTSDTILPKVYSINKGLDPNVNWKASCNASSYTKTHILPELKKCISC